MTGRLSAVPDLPPEDDLSGGPAGLRIRGPRFGAPGGPGGPRRSGRPGGIGPRAETAAGSGEAATFRVRCPECGPQIIPISAVRFVQTAIGDDPSANRYVFTCPQCRAKVRRPAGPELAEILRASGVATLALHQWFRRTRIVPLMYWLLLITITAVVTALIVASSGGGSSSAPRA